MKILLDTQCWLWWLASPDRFSESSRSAIVSASNDIYLSAASSWEIAIKYAIGKLPLPEDPAHFVTARLARDGISALPIEHAHALRVAELPLIHRDPFDRLLIAQAQLEKLVLLTADPLLARYDVEILSAS